MKKDHIEIPAPSSKFQKVKCDACKATQVVYSHASTKVTCNTCGGDLAEATGSKARINGEILESAE